MSDFSYIVVEGPIGAGKTTPARRLAESFATELLPGELTLYPQVYSHVDPRHLDTV